MVEKIEDIRKKIKKAELNISRYLKECFESNIHIIDKYDIWLEHSIYYTKTELYQPLNKPLNDCIDFCYHYDRYEYVPMVNVMDRIFSMFFGYDINTEYNEEITIKEEFNKLPKKRQNILFNIITEVIKENVGSFLNDW